MNAELAWLRKSLLGAGVVQHGSFTLFDGGTSPVYFDVKRAYGIPIILSALAQELVKDIPRGTLVAGLGNGGIPLAAALCAYGQRHALYARNAPKAHGLRSRIDGAPVGTGDSVFLVDDVLTTGRSLRSLADAVRVTGARVTGAGVVVRRNQVQLDFPLVALFEADDLL